MKLIRYLFLSLVVTITTLSLLLTGLGMAKANIGHPFQTAPPGGKTASVFPSGVQVNSGASEAFTITPMSSGTTSTLYGVWGSSATDVFAVGASGTILHYDGSTWSPMTSDATLALYDVWGDSATSDVFAMGHVHDSPILPYCVFHYDGSVWSNMEIPYLGVDPALYGIWGASANDVFAVGRGSVMVGNVQPRILHYDGSSWSEMMNYGGSIHNVWLHDVWGDPATSDVFAVGDVYKGIPDHPDKYCVLRYDGSSWNRMTGGELEVVSELPHSNTLYGIWGTSTDDVFAVGEQGTILHYDGSTWSRMTSGTTMTLSGIWGSSGDNILVVGESGTILHYNGAAWLPMTIGSTPNLLGIWGSSETDVFVVGEGGTILKIDTSNMPRTLNMAVNGSGTTTPATGSYNCFDGIAVNITALPDSGWHFVNWTGDVSTVENVSKSYTKITMDGNYSIVANFAIDVAEVTVYLGQDTLVLRKGNKPITAYIELPEGYDVNDIDTSTILLNQAVVAQKKPVKTGDENGNGISDLMVKFKGKAVRNILQPGEEVEISVSGQLMDGTPFEGTDTIRVRD